MYLPLSAPCRKVLGSSLKTGSFVRLDSISLRSSGGFPRRTPAGCRCTGRARWRWAAVGGRSAQARPPETVEPGKDSPPMLVLKPSTQWRAGLRHLTFLTFKTTLGRQRRKLAFICDWPGNLKLSCCIIWCWIHNWKINFWHRLPLLRPF